METLLAHVGTAWTPSPRGNFLPNADLFIQASLTMFGTQEDRLLQRAPILHTITLRLRTLQDGAGRSIREAIVLRGVRPEVLDFYMTYVNAAAEADLPALEARESVSFLGAVMKVAVLFGDRDGARYAMRRLHVHRDFTPFHRYTLSIEFRIATWFIQSMNYLVDNQRVTWHDKQFDLLPGDAIRRVLAIKDRVLEDRQTMISDPPISAVCRTCPLRCMKKWARFWVRHIVGVLRTWPHEGPSHGAVVIDILEAQREAAIDQEQPVCVGCLDANIALLDRRFAVEHDLVIEMMDDWYKTQRFGDWEAARELILKRRGEIVEYGGYELEADVGFLASLANTMFDD